MTKILSVLLFLISFLLLPKQFAQAQQASSDSLTLHQAIHLALTNQPSLQKVQAQINAAKAQVGQSKSTLYPQLNAKGDFVYLSPVSSLALNGETFQIMPKKNYNTHLALNQLIYDFGRTQANIDLAKSRVLTARQQKRVVKWTISYFTAQTFYSVLFEKRNLKVVNKQLSQLKSDLDIAQKKHKFGAATNFEVLRIKVQVANEKNMKRDIKNQREKLKITLRRLFGWKPQRMFHVSGELAMKPVQAAANLSTIYKSRPDYRALQLKEKSLQNVFKLNSLLNRPSLSIAGTAGFKNGYVPDLDEFLGNYSIGIHLKVPIFDGFSVRYKKQQAKANISAVKASTLKLQRAIQADVAKAKADIQNGKKKLPTAQLEVKQAQEGLKLARTRFKNGAITSTDLLAAETALAQARFQQVTDVYNILLSQYDLKKAMGVNIWR